MPDLRASVDVPCQLTLQTVSTVQPNISEAIAKAAEQKIAVVIDLQGVSEFDSAGAALLAWSYREATRRSVQLQLVNAPDFVERTLRAHERPALGSKSTAPRLSFVEGLGDQAANWIEQLQQMVQMSADAMWFALTTLTRRHRLRPGVVTWEMAQMGSRALGVVGLIAFLVGATMGLQSAAQLRRFGADIFVVDLIVVSLLRELGPLMAAIVVAGRSGAAVAAELGTMMVTEEVDALATMGLHPVRFLVVPKIFAITVVQPLLTIFANVLGIAGGFGVAVIYLDVSPDAFVARLQEILEVKDILTGLVKSVLFAWLIVLVGAHFGFTTRGGADAVGRSTTSSVVAGIFAVVVMDAIASLVFYFGG